jgi:hypothetical protein
MRFSSEHLQILDLLNSLQIVTYLATTVTNRIDIHNESKSRLNSEKAYYCTVQNLLPSCALSKSLKIHIYTETEAYKKTKDSRHEIN